MDLGFLMGRYDGELKRKDQITGAVSFPVTILTLLGSVVVTMAKGLSLDTPPVTIGYFISLATWAGVTSASLWFLSRAYHGSTYEFLPRLMELEEFQQDGEIKRDFDALFRRAIIDATDTNAVTNDVRQAYLDRGNVFLLVAVVLGASCGGFYVADQILKR